MTWRAQRALLLLVAALYASPALAQESRTYKGMLLAEALRDLQTRGLRIVFSSAIVPAGLRVSAEPRARTPRQQLEELLAPHGLEVREGPGGTLQVVQGSASKRTRREARGALDGQVVDARTAAPLPGVLVRIDGHSVDAQTDATGRFAVRQVAKGTRMVGAFAAGYIPARRTVEIDAETRATVTLRLFPETPGYREYVSVIDSAPIREDRGVASESTLDRSDFARLHGSVAEDPLRAVHSFPGVTAGDDFRSDFVVRGSPFRHVGLVVDGVSTHWLQHTALGRGATGSLTMLSGLVVESATLRTGAYPRRHGDRLGPELDLRLREGSRSEFAMRGAVGGAHAVLAAEGPLGAPGPTGSARGSWLVSARQSYLEWPPERSASGRTPFGFSDGLAKVVFDVRRTQQVALTAIGGITSVDDDDENRAPNEPADGSNRASALSLSWRSTFGPLFVIRQQASVVAHRYRNTEPSGRERDRGASRAVGYRAELTRAVPGGLLEAGAQIERITTRQNSQSPDATPIDGRAWQRSGFLHIAWAATPSLTVSPGVRVAWLTAVQRTPAVSRWLLGQWSLRPGWNLLGSAGASRQMPELAYGLGDAGSRDLRPERATHFDLGIEQKLASGVRWQATVFHRREADVVRFPDLHPRLVGNAIVFPARQRYVNALQGTSRGIELLVSRRTPLGLSGWAAYSYGRAHQADIESGERFWADSDQRHAFNVFGGYRFSEKTSVAATFRTGSNFPVPGYLAERNGRLLVATGRNQVRLHAYARLDLRADRQVQYLGRRLTLFVEARNALNRANQGLAGGSVDPSTGEAIGFTDRLLRRSVSGGVVIEF